VCICVDKYKELVDADDVPLVGIDMEMNERKKVMIHVFSKILKGVDSGIIYARLGTRIKRD
jgi:hypothetical protein